MADSGHIALARRVRHAKKPGKLSRAEIDESERLSFTEHLIRAIEDAQLASESKSGASLAQEGYSKLQYDFPLVSAEELDALAAAYRTHEGGPPLTSKFIEVVRDGAARGGTAAPVEQPIATEPRQGGRGARQPAGAPDPLPTAYQKLYAAAVLCTLRRALSEPVEEAEVLLLKVDAPVPPLPHPKAAIEHPLLGPAATSIPQPPREQAACVAPGAHPELEEDGYYEPIDCPARDPYPAENGGAAELAGKALAARPGTWEQAVLPKVVHLAEQLSYGCVCDAAVWRELDFFQAAADCVAAMRRHPHFMALRPAAEALCALAHDRIASAPAEVCGLAALLDALGVSELPGDGGLNAAGAAAVELALGASASLAGHLSTLSSRRRLWQEVHDVLLPAGARLLAHREAQQAQRARRGPSAGTEGEEEARGAMVVSHLAFYYVLHAPPAASAPAKLQAAMLRGGLFRSLTLLFLRLGGAPAAEPLRRALLAACAAAPGLGAWAAAVPGFAAAWEGAASQPAGRCQLHGALWAAASGQEGADSAVAAALSLAHGPLGADALPAVYADLHLLGDLHEASRGSCKLWGSATRAALMALGAALRSASFGEDVGRGAAAGGRGGEPPEVDLDAEAQAEERKLSQTPERQAAVLAARRARQLQPECLRLVKALTQRLGAAGKDD